MAANPTAVSPQLARSLQATENMWRSISAEYGLLTSGQVAELLGASPSNRTLASRRRAAHQIAGVVRRNAVLYPAFQFDRSQGTILPVMAQIIRLAAATGWHEKDLLLWICSPTTSFEGQDRPVDHFHDPDSVLAAAKAQFEAQW
ncbi:hypothetical protein E3T23_02785 [Cryobacterium cheniae]|uniref:DNA-binding protein n=2 Tax=Cryobacterium cheniae TaxID=1259262 RepID=A0A4R8XZB1_9MICO|nr:hypothetical protein E3T23_02785 [Cryobacterium cheniae]